MISDSPIAGAAILILLILGANFIMYAVARGWAKNGGSTQWIDALKQGLTKPMDSKHNQSMEELRQQMEKLQKNSEKKE